MAVLNENPFAVLTAVVAPAILTNACSVLCLGTSNRIARVVDRTRIVSAHIASVEAGSLEHRAHVTQLERHHEFKVDEYSQLSRLSDWRCWKYRTDLSARA